jgi:glycosyltransferase 2 family protein
MDSTPTPRPSILRSRALHLGIAAIFAGILLYYSLRGIPWPQVWSTLSHADPKYILAWLGIVTFALFLRAVRWRVLLSAEGPVPIPTAFWATSAGYFGNNFLPARAGELVRTLMISARTGMNKSFVLTTALSERIFDAITLVGIAAMVLLTLPIKPGWFRNAATPFSIIGLGGVLAIVLLPKFEPLWAAILRKLPIPSALTEKLIGIMEQVLAGIRAFHDWKRLSIFMVFTVVIWSCDSLTAVIGMYALGMNISLAVAFLLITGLALGSALPSTPGYVGIYQFVAVSVLVPFGFSKADAVAYILLFQGLQFAITAFWGLLALTRNKGVSFSVPTPVTERP